MNRTDDISNLFSRFGASSDSYHEFESQFDYKEEQETLELEKTAVTLEAVPEVVVETAPAPAAQPGEEIVEAEKVEPQASVESAPLELSASTSVAEPLVVPEVELTSQAQQTPSALQTPGMSGLSTAKPELGTSTLLNVAETAPIAELSEALENVEAPEVPPVLVAPVTPEIPAVVAAPDNLAAPAAPEEQLLHVAAATAPAKLRNLLAEVIQARQVEAQVLSDEALRHAATKARPAKCKAHIVVLVSLKGGVGKTTLSAGLASSLRMEGGRTLAIDLDPQNALQFHLGVEQSVSGIGSANMAGQNWNDRLQHGFDGSLLLPYGVLSDDECHSLTREMAEDRHWLAHQLDSMNLSEQDVVIIDTPTGSTQYLEQALDVADEVIVVTTADAASFITLDQIDRVLGASDVRPAYSHCNYVVNQFDANREFSRDMLQVLKRRLGEQLMAVVSLDNTLGEALAYGRNPLATAEASVACKDVLLLGEQLKARFETSRAQGIEAQ